MANRYPLTAFRSNTVVVDTKYDTQFQIVGFSKDSVGQYIAVGVTATGGVVVLNTHDCTRVDFVRSQTHDHLSFQKAWFQANHKTALVVRGATTQVGMAYDTVDFVVNSRADAYEIAQILVSSVYKHVSVTTGNTTVIKTSDIEKPHTKWTHRATVKQPAKVLVQHHASHSKAA